MQANYFNQYLLQKGNEAGMCEQGALAIAQAGGVDEMLAVYRTGIDFCLSAGFPSNEDLVKIGGSSLAGHGICVDQPVEARDAEFMVLLGACSGRVTASGYTVSQLFIKHQSTAEVVVTDNAFLVIDCFDGAQVQVTASGNCKVLVNVYGDAKVTHQASDRAVVKIVNKNKGTY